MLVVPTDGTLAAEERLRTLTVVTAPQALTRGYRDYVAVDGVEPQPIDADLIELAGFPNLTWIAIGYLLLVAACSLTVSAVAGLMERRRPFALLRASGTRLGELRQIALLETAAPLALTAIGCVGLALLVGRTFAADAFAVPDLRFFLTMGGALLGASPSRSSPGR